MATTQSALNSIFQEELGRNIGAVGLESFGADLAGGMSLDEIRQTVANSPEAQAASTGTDAAQINQIFQNTLGREVDQEGLFFYTKALRAGVPINEIRSAVENSQEAQQQIRQDSPPSGLAGSEQALQAGLQGSLSAVTQGLDVAGDSIRSGQRALQPFAGAGRQAIGMQAALSGAQGAGAQQQAFDNFNSSPGQEFLRNRGERALLRNSGAIGGLGGGRVRQALQQHGIGMAQQDFGNQFNRLGQVSAMGLQGAGQQAGLAGQLAGEQALGGRVGGGFAFGTGQQLAGGRTRAGEMISQAIGGTTQGLASLQQQQGAQQSDLLGAAGGNLAGLLQGSGQQAGVSRERMAEILANISTGTATGPQASSAQFIQQGGNMQGVGNILSAVGGIASLSDRRLKTNIKQCGELPNGLNVYTWDWTEEGQRLAGNSQRIGVIAQEAQEVMPSAVIEHESGYLMVNYGALV